MSSGILQTARPALRGRAVSVVRFETGLVAAEGHDSGCMVQTRQIAFRKTPNHMSNQLVTVEAGKLPVEVLSKINEFITGKLAAYGIKRELRWGSEGTFSKMVGAAQDRDGFTQDKKVRRVEFQRIQAVFVLENINELILALLLKDGWQPRFGGTNVKGDTATMRFVETQKAKSDTIGKLADGMRTEQERARELETEKVRNKRIMALLEESGDSDLLEKVRKIGFEILPKE